MFSAAATIAVTFHGSFISAAARIAPSTAHAPLLSPFIVSMNSDGFMSRPPLSKVSPLPTSAMWPLAFSGS